MKEPWSISKDNLVALEEGTSRKEEHVCAKPAGKNDVCKQAVQCVKLFLYLGLLIIVGWACYSLWQPYHAQSMEVKVVAIIREPESQNLLLREEQPTHETNTIAARPVYGSEDSLKRQDAVDDLQIFPFDDQGEILNSENTESSLGWPTSTDYPDLPKGMNFLFFSPSFSSMKMGESEKEPGSSESAQRLFDISTSNTSEESQQLNEDEKNLLESYMLLSLFVQNSLRFSEALKDPKEVVDPKFQLKLEDSGRLGLENSGPLELEDSSRLKLDNSGPLHWFRVEIGSNLKVSEEEPISIQTDDNYERPILNILNNTHEIDSEDSTVPEQEETLIKSNEQVHQSIDSAFGNWFARSVFGERKHEVEQSLLEQSTVRNAEASEDSTEEVDHNFKLTSEDLSGLELDNSSPLQRIGVAIGSDLEDSEEEPISTETDDNYESATLNILNNTHEIVSEDSTEPEQEETLIKSNEQVHQSIDSAVEDWYDESASEDRQHDEEQATHETEAEIEDDSIGNTQSLGLHSDTDGSSLKNESDKEPESDSFSLETYKWLLHLARRACSDRSSYSWELDDPEDYDNSYESGVQDTCNIYMKAICMYKAQRQEFTDCSKYDLFWLKGEVRRDFDTSYGISV